MYKSVYNLPCTCNLMRNGNLVPFNGKGKGKRIHLYAYFDQNSEKMNYTKHPFLQLEPSNSNESLYKCGLYQVSKINQTLINEGKITIDVVEGEQSVNLQMSDISLKQSLVQKQMAHLCVSDSTQQSLKLFIQKIQNLIQQYAEKSRKSTEVPSEQKQQSLKQQQNKAVQDAAAKGHFQFKVEKRVSINQMKINLQQSVKPDSEKEKQLVVKDVIEVDKQPITKNVTKQFNKIDQQNIIQKENKAKYKEQQSPNHEKEKKKTREKSIEKAKQVEDIIVELQMEDEEQDEQSLTQKLSKTKESLKENKLYQICEEGLQNENQNISQEKTLEQLQQLYVSSDNTSIESRQLLSPSIQYESKQKLNQLQKNGKDQLLSPQANAQLASPQATVSPTVVNNQQQFLISNSNQKQNNKDNSVQNQLILPLEMEHEVEREQQNRQILQEEDNLLTEQKKLLSKQQLMLCERQLLLTQQEKLLRKQQLISNQQILEDSLNQEEIKLMKQREQLEKQIQEFEQTSRGGQNDIQMQKYFLEKRNIELQYENEQKLLQSQTESNLQANNSKFMGFQNKLQEIKHKQQQKKLESIQQQASNKKNLYKVDRSITSKALYSNGQTLALKRRNPFSLDEENEEEQLNNPDQYYVQTSTIHQSSQENIVANNNQMEEQKQQNDMLEEQATILNKYNSISDNNNNKSIFKLKDGVTPADLPAQFQSVKKLGNKYIFEKNSFNIKLLDDNEEENQLPDRQKIYSQSKLKLNNKSSQESQLQDKQIKNSEKIKELLMQLPEHVMANILQFISKKQLYQIRLVSKFFNYCFFLSIKKLIFIKRDTPSERVLHMLDKAKYIQTLQIGQLVNLKPDLLLEKVEQRQIFTLTKLDISNYTSLTTRLFTAFLKQAKQLQDISIPFFSRVSDDLLLQMDGYVHNLQRLALKSVLDNFQANEKISDISLAKVITDNRKLHTFELFTTSPSLFEKIEYYQNIKKEKFEQKMQKNTELNTMHLLKPYDDVYSRLTTLKIRNLVMTRFAEDDLSAREKNLQKLELLKNLKVLKIVNIVKKSKGEWFLPYTPSNNILQNIFSNLKQIQHLSLGQWCTNDVLLTISEKINTLVKIRLIGNQVDDTGLEYIFQKMEQLNFINIVDATRINGHCFESIISRNIQVIKVKFDDFRLNCLNSTITHVLQLNGVKITNYTK